MIFDSHRTERWIYRRVKWPTLEELGDYDCFIDGNLELSALSDLKASGQLNYISESPAGDDLVRVYYSFTDVAGESASFALGTFFMSDSSPLYDGNRVSGSVDLESLLRVAMAGGYGRPYVVKQGTNAVAKATSILESVGLKTNKATSTYTVSRDIVYDETETWLSIVNDLLSMAGYASVSPDPYGVMQLSPYVEPSARVPSWTFRDDEHSIMLPAVSMNDNARSIHNVCILTYSNDEESLWAKCSNTDPLSEFSVARRGYEDLLRETVSELSGTTKAARLTELKNKAKSKLVDDSSKIEHVSWSFPWVPLWPNDAVAIDYLTANLEWAGAITDMSIPTGGHAQVTAKARKFVRAGFSTSIEGGSW